MLLVIYPLFIVIVIVITMINNSQLFDITVSQIENNPKTIIITHQHIHHTQLNQQPQQHLLTILFQKLKLFNYGDRISWSLKFCIEFCY